MEVFIEYMVKKSKKPSDYLKVMGVMLGGFILILFVMGFLGTMVPFLGSFVLLISVGIIYLMYMFITSINIEFEYILTDSELDVDKIINVRRRKRLTTVNIRGVDCFAKISSPEFNRYNSNAKVKKIYACRDVKDSETCFVVFTSNDETKMLFFNPNEKISDRIKTLNPQKTYIG